MILKDYPSVDVRRKLRETVSTVESEYAAGLDSIIAPFVWRLQYITVANDDALLDTKNRRDITFNFICPESGDMKVTRGLKGEACSMIPFAFQPWYD